MTGPQGAQLRTAIAAVQRICPEFNPVQMLRRSGRTALLVGTSGRSPAVAKCLLDQSPAWVERFFRLWCRNQWKRERYAPSFHLDDENLDPKTWCRFPILNSGFEKELEDLRAYLRSSTSR